MARWLGRGTGAHKVESGLAAAAATLARTLAAENDRLVLWGPVLFGAGIAFYFGLRSEPSTLVVGGALMVLITLVVLARPWPWPPSA